MNLGRKLFPLFALALDLPEDFFDDKASSTTALTTLVPASIEIAHGIARQTKNAAAIMRVLHYPPQTGPVDDRVIGIGAHTECVVASV